MRIVFMGTPPAAVPTLRRLLVDGHDVVAVWTQPDRPAGRGDRMRSPAVKEFAQQNDLSIEQPARIKTVETKDLFKSYGADVAVIVAYGRILPAEYLSAPNRGCINVHFSLLPLYRGAAPVNWAIINGEKKTGVTTMFMEEELDSGPILKQRETDVAARETAPELMDRLAEMGAELLGETLSQLDQLTPRSQRDRDATFAPILTKRDGLIDWSNDAVAIERSIRGFQPWPTAYTNYRSQSLIVWKAEPVSSGSGDGVPGEVVVAHGDELVVECGSGTALRIVEVQPQSKRRLSVRDFLNGAHVKIGERFGEA